MDSPKSDTIPERVSSTKKSKKSLVDSLRATKNLVNTSKDFLVTPTKKLQNSSGNSSRRSSSVRKTKPIALDRFSIKPKEFIDDDFKDISSVFEDSDISFSVDAKNSKDTTQKKHSLKSFSGNILESVETDSKKSTGTTSVEKLNQTNQIQALNSSKKTLSQKLQNFESNTKNPHVKTLKQVDSKYSGLRRLPRKRKAIQSRNEISNISLIPEKKAKSDTQLHNSSVSPKHKGRTTQNNKNSKKKLISQSFPIGFNSEVATANMTPQRRSKRIQKIQESSENKSPVIHLENKAKNNKMKEISDEQAALLTTSLDEMLDISDGDNDSDFEVIEEKNDDMMNHDLESKNKKKQSIISIERLKTDKQVKLNALDITISTIVEFLKNYIKENPEANKFQIMEKYLNAVYVYLLNLLDSNLLVLSLNSGLRSLKQRKLNLRHQIVELQLKNSKTVDHELILLRNNNVKLFNFENDMLQLVKNLADLRKKKKRSHAIENSEINGLLFKLNGIVNPGWPIIKKLEKLNEALKSLDTDLSEKLSKY